VIGYHEAVARLTEGAALRGAQTVASGDALGRVLAAAVISDIALPPFDNAALDGVALVTGGLPVPVAQAWEIGARIGAGDPAPEDEASAWEIMTGAPLPARADTVVPVERVEVLPASASGASRIRVQGQVVPGANIRRRGEDMQPGQCVLPVGHVLDAGALMLIAGLGVDRIHVAKRPRVAVLATGREIVAAGAPLPPGGIHDATSPYLALVLAAAGAQAVHISRVGDDVAAFQAALDAALADSVDLILSTGAVSKGCYDFVPAALDARGADFLFHGVAIRPGKPVLAARLREGPLFVGLPGNPLSTAVGFRFLVEPLLRAWLGLPPETPRWLPLAEDCRTRAGLHAAFHGTLRCDDAGRLHAHVALAQASFRLLPFSQASAWITLPAGAGDVAAGTPVQVHGLSHLQPPGWTPA
jgi:molybdopterin molybdotransferase